MPKRANFSRRDPFEGGGGIFILNTTSAEEAESWVETDPAVQAKRWDLEVLPYTPRIGSICPASAPYQMGILYVCAIQRHRREFTASTYPLLIRQHEDFGKEIGKEYNIVTEAIFGPNEGGILVIKEDLPSDAFSSDPGVEQGLIDAQIKKLYIARTSFCER